MHWLQTYIEKPWRAYAYGPDAYDCFGLIYDVLTRHFNQTLPRITGVKTDCPRQITRAFLHELSTGRWQQQTVPDHGSVVVCYVQKDETLLVRHVGLYLMLDGGGVLHSRDGAGVRFDHLAALTTAFKKVEFYGSSD